MFPLYLECKKSKYAFMHVMNVSILTWHSWYINSNQITSKKEKKMLRRVYIKINPARYLFRLCTWNFVQEKLITKNKRRKTETNYLLKNSGNIFSLKMMILEYQLNLTMQTNKQSSVNWRSNFAAIKIQN